MSGVLKRQAIQEAYRTVPASAPIGAPDAGHFSVLLSLLSAVFNAPFCMIDLTPIDTGWLEFESSTGIFPLPRTMALPRELDGSSDRLVIMDTLRDPRFRAVPEVLGAPFIRFFAGALVCDCNSTLFGRLCVMDYRPRYFSDHDVKKLGQFSEIASGILAAARKQRAVPHRA